MGLHSTPTLRRSLLSAVCRGPILIFTTTLLPSLADLSGVFDAPQGKCPPVGSVGHVTGVPSHFSRAEVPKGADSNSQYSFERSFPTSRTSAPIQLAKPNQTQHLGLSTPPITPEDDNTLLACRQHRATAFMASLFPEHVSLVLSQSAAVKIDMASACWDGFVLEMPDASRTLYLDGQNLGHSILRESVVALLDLADEHFGCSALVIALQRTTKGLDEIIHSLMYVGGQVVTRTPFHLNSAFVLIGLEI